MAVFFLIFSFAAMGVGYLLEGGHVEGLWGYTAFIIVVGGTVGATALSTPIDVLAKLGGGVAKALFKSKKKVVPTVARIIDLAETARKEGLLSLEKRTDELKDDRFLQSGVLMAVDGASGETIKAVLELEIEQRAQKNKDVAKVFETAGGYAPTMGIIGTVMGLVHVLSNLADPASLGGSIATAFLATLYGIATANLIYLPFGNKLKSLNESEVNLKVMIIEGITAISSGESPKQILSNLEPFIPDNEMQSFKKQFPEHQ